MILALPKWNWQVDIHRWRSLALTVFFAGGFSFIAGFSMADVSSVQSAGAVSSKILDRDGNILYEIHGEVKRSPVKLGQISPYLISATIATEDEGFYRHTGVEPKAIVRALWTNLQAGAVQQGGSTITQQLVKNTLLTREKSLQRKIKEAVLAVKTEFKYSKDEILTMYLNTAPFGRNSYGAEAAALSYFGKHAIDLNIAEAAYLAALPKAPSYLSPFGENVDELEARKNYILNRMHTLGFITSQERDEAQQAKVAFHHAKTGISAPYFVKMVVESLERAYGRKFLETAGLEVYTTLNSEYQKSAEDIIRTESERNVQANKAHNAALVAIDVKTGEVLALVGGKSYFGRAEPEGCRSGINCKFDPNVNAAVALRQPGSSFKPYTYVTAFSPEFGFSPASMVLDQRTNFSTGAAPAYIPRNYTNRDYGLVSMRRALAGSLNVSAVRTLSLIGVSSVAETAHKAGIRSQLNDCGLSLTLGACEVRLLDHVSGFATLASLGTYVEPTIILKIVNKDGREIPTRKPEPKQVLDPRAAYLVVDTMKDNSARSFVFGPRSALVLPDRVVAAKTGTSQNFRDGWALGFTPSIAVGVWTGNNDSSFMRPGADGVITAGPIWNKFMRAVTEGTPAEDFPRPEGIQEVRVSASNGKLATEYTPRAVTELFADYNMPKEKDPFRPPPPEPEPEEGIQPDGTILVDLSNPTTKATASPDPTPHPEPLPTTQ